MNGGVASLILESFDGMVSSLLDLVRPAHNFHDVSALADFQLSVHARVFVKFEKICVFSQVRFFVSRA